MNEVDPQFLPEIRVGKIGVLKVHQISDDELSRLEAGSSQSLWLNLSVAILSAAIAFFIALKTATFSDDRTYRLFSDVTVFGFVLGAILLIVWWFTRKPVKQLAKEIRDRMPPEGEAQDMPDFQIPLLEDHSTSLDEA